MALRPGAGGGRGGLPPAGSPPAPRGARRLDPEQSKSAVVRLSDHIPLPGLGPFMPSPLNVAVSDDNLGEDHCHPLATRLNGPLLLGACACLRAE